MNKTCSATGTGPATCKAPRDPGVEELITEIENLLPGFASVAFRTKDLADRVMGAGNTPTVSLTGTEEINASDSIRARLGGIYHFLREKLHMTIEQLDRIY